MPNSYAFETIAGAAGSAVVVLCDHATRHIPPEISRDDLGLALDDLQRHIAYDIGALEVARLIAAELDATLVASHFSRLLIDANRGEDDPTLVMRLYDGTIIPGNRQISNEEVARRLAQFHRPYRAEIGRVLDEKLAAGIAPALLSIHSFTPQLRGQPKRPWHLGVLWEGENPLAQALIAGWRQLPGAVVGDNQPYSGQLPGSTLAELGRKRGLPHVLIEYRNDLIEDAAGQREWAQKTMPVLRRALAAVTENANG